eukprot:scaffold144409_cov30-Cyclotella_meneghiniana.AAC.2
MGGATMIHDCNNPMQRKLSHRGATLWAYACPFEHMAGDIEWPEPKSDEDSKDLDAIKEFSKLSEIDKQIMQTDIKEGIKGLAKRFKIDHAIPALPDNLFEEAIKLVPENVCNNYQDLYKQLDVDYWMKCYPVLDRRTAMALEQQTDDDHCASELIFAIGAYFVSQNWSDAELEKWTSISVYAQNAKSRAKKIAYLTVRVLFHCYNDGGGVMISDLEHVAELIQRLPLVELQDAAEEAGVTITTSAFDTNHKIKAALVVALLEYIFSDVIEPVATASA